MFSWCPVNMSGKCFMQALEDLTAASQCEQKETILAPTSIFQLVPGAHWYFEICSHQDITIIISNSTKNGTWRKAEETKTKESYFFNKEKTMVLRITHEINTNFWKVKMGQYLLNRNLAQRYVQEHEPILIPFHHIHIYIYLGNFCIFSCSVTGT